MWNDAYYDNKLKVWIDLTTTCNAKCPQCHRTNFDGLEKQKWIPNFSWTFDEFKKSYPPSTMSHIKEFEFCGTWGDPVTNPDIYNIIDYIIKESNSKILMNTNGSLRSEDWWFKLGFLTQNRLKVYFAVDGTTQKMHEMYRRNTNLNKVLSNMDAFSSYGISYTFVVTFKHNEKYLDEIKKLVEKHGSSKIIFMPSNRFDKKNTFNYFYKNQMFILEEPDYNSSLYDKKLIDLALKGNVKN